LAEFLLAVFPAPPFLAIGLFFFLKDEGILNVLTPPRPAPVPVEGVAVKAGRGVAWSRRDKGEVVLVGEGRRGEEREEMRREVGRTGER
jgi:hypothetical protein